MLINRFMINLRTAGSELPESDYMSDQQQGRSTLQFRMPTDRLGNIGGTLRDGWTDELCSEEGDTAGVGEEGRHENDAEV